MVKSEIYIKNMVCPRCIMAVENIFKQEGIDIDSIQLGKVVVKGKINKKQKSLLANKLQSLGFELLNDKKTKTIEQIKNCVIDFVHYQDNIAKENLSDYIVSNLHQDYSSLSKIFSQEENTTIDRYFITQKIEKVKELLSYDELTLNEIAFKLNYSSSAYLSAQFKKETGMTPSEFKKISLQNRKALDSI